jgi:hypothetical protein
MGRGGLGLALVAAWCVMGLLGGARAREGGLRTIAAEEFSERLYLADEIFVLLIVGPPEECGEICVRAAGGGVWRGGSLGATHARGSSDVRWRCGVLDGMVGVEGGDVEGG